MHKIHKLFEMISMLVVALHSTAHATAPIKLSTTDFNNTMQYHYAICCMIPYALDSSLPPSLYSV